MSGVDKNSYNPRTFYGLSYTANLMGPCLEENPAHLGVVLPHGRQVDAVGGGGCELLGAVEQRGATLPDPGGITLSTFRGVGWRNGGKCGGRSVNDKIRGLLPWVKIP